MNKSVKNIERYSDNLEKLKVKCSCGHTTIMPVYINKKICSHCGKIVKNNTKLYFMYQLRKELNKNENNN